jgi:rRNA methylases
MLYSSIDNDKIKEFKKLQNKKYRDKKGLFFVEGEHLVLEAYKKGWLETLILSEDSLLPLNVETMYVTNNILHYLTELETPQLAMGVCRKIDSKKIDGNVMLLDDIQDPGNLGTIIRSAAAFNLDTLVISKNSVDPYNQKVIRASQGLIFHVNIIINDLVDTIVSLKENGYNILGTKVTHGKNIKTIEKRCKFAIIMGNEGNGMSEDVHNLCDEFVYIDMNEKCESLNVGVAASILLYELDK